MLREKEQLEENQQQKYQQNLLNTIFTYKRVMQIFLRWYKLLTFFLAELKK